MTDPNTYEDLLYKFHNQVEDDDDDEVLIAPKRPLRTFFIITSPKDNWIKWGYELASSYGFEFDLNKSMEIGRIVAWPSEDSNDQILLENLEDDRLDYRVVKARRLSEIRKG